MKRVLILSLSLLSFAGIQAQNAEQTDYKNNIQFNPIDAVLFGSFELKYERAITENSTVILGIGLKPSAGLLKIPGIDSETIKTDDFKLTGISIVPEYRWYFQKKATKRTGLYAGGYYKFRTLTDNIEGTYTSSNTGTTSPLGLDARFTTHSIGAVFGYKAMLGKHLYVDILIAGPGYTSAKLKFTETKPLPPEMYDDLSTELEENFGLLFEHIKGIDINETDSNSAESKFSLPMFRYGFKIGYSF